MRVWVVIISVLFMACSDAVMPRVTPGVIPVDGAFVAEDGATQTQPDGSAGLELGSAGGDAEADVGASSEVLAEAEVADSGVSDDAPSGPEEVIAAPDILADGGSGVADAQVAPVPYEPCAEENLEVDTDGDGWSDCDELSDTLESTDPTQFNGLTATIGLPPEGFFSSAQCGLFFGTDFGQLDQHFTGSTQSMSIRSGWEYSAGNTAEYSDAGNFDFDPNWDNSDNVGEWSSFQILYAGWVHFDESGRHCVSIDTGAGGFGPGDIAGRRNNCGLFYLNPEPATAPLTETGYGSNESPHTGCGDYEAGWHRIAIAARHYETYFYSPKLALRWCFGLDQDCAPDVPFGQEHMWSDAEAVPLPETLPVDGGDSVDAGMSVTDGSVGAPELGPEGDVGSEPVEDSGPAGQEGACTNIDDLAIIDGLGPQGLEDAIKDCGTPCFFDGDKQGCIRACIVDDIGLSVPCADCYAASGACGMAYCVSECIDGGADCIECLELNGCQDDFTACSGLED